MPGLLRGIARTAAVVGTAQATRERVARRQQNRWADQDQAQYAPQPAPAPRPAPQPQPAVAPPACCSRGRSDRAVRAAGGTEGAGHSDRCRVRRSEAKGPRPVGPRGGRSAWPTEAPHRIQRSVPGLGNDGDAVAEHLCAEDDEEDHHHDVVVCDEPFLHGVQAPRRLVPKEEVRNDGDGHSD